MRRSKISANVCCAPPDCPAFGGARVVPDPGGGPDWSTTTPLTGIRGLSHPEWSRPTGRRWRPCAPPGNQDWRECRYYRPVRRFTRFPGEHPLLHQRPRVHNTPMFDQQSIVESEVVADSDTDRSARGRNPHELSSMSSCQPGSRGSGIAFQRSGRPPRTSRPASLRGSSRTFGRSPAFVGSRPGMSSCSTKSSETRSSIAERSPAFIRSKNRRASSLVLSGIVSLLLRCNGSRHGQCAEVSEVNGRDTGPRSWRQ